MSIPTHRALLQPPQSAPRADVLPSTVSSQLFAVTLDPEHIEIPVVAQGGDFFVATVGEHCIGVDFLGNTSSTAPAESIAMAQRAAATIREHLWQESKLRRGRRQESFSDLAVALGYETPVWI